MQKQQTYYHKSNIFKSLVKSFILLLTPKHVYFTYIIININNLKLENTNLLFSLRRVYLSVPLYAARLGCVTCFETLPRPLFMFSFLFSHSGRHKNPFLLPKQTQEGNGRMHPLSVPRVLPRLSLCPSVHTPALFMFMSPRYRTCRTVLEACIDLEFRC